jgi:glutamate/tyrosine decarboxylase-like PLP-dependent enzyme
MDNASVNILSKALSDFNEWEKSFGSFTLDEVLKIKDQKFESVINDLVVRLKGNYPFHHPVYAGQMLKTPHSIAWTAYTLAMNINPNNHALDGGPPSSEMEKEVMAELAHFFGFKDQYLAHLTSSGTIGNLEALWIARKIHPSKKIGFSTNAHYTHSRMCELLGIGQEIIPINKNGDFDFSNIDANTIGTLVVTLGTTGLGEVEPLDQALLWAKQHGIRIHVDAAYGGFFRCLKDSGLINGSSWKIMQKADSIVVDPHKHGLQPYGCGAVLFKDPSVGTFYKHDSPYTYFSSDDLHLGEISIECSRAGAAAVAFWATLQCFPLKEKEGFGPILAKCRNAALKGFRLIEESEKLITYKKPELDILTYFPIQVSTSNTSQISELSKKVFQKGMDEQSFFLSLYKVPSPTFVHFHPQFKADSDTVTILRSVLMRPEHESFIPELIRRIEEAV